MNSDMTREEHLAATRELQKAHANSLSKMEDIVAELERWVSVSFKTLLKQLFLILCLCEMILSNV